MRRGREESACRPYQCRSAGPDADRSSPRSCPCAASIIALPPDRMKRYSALRAGFDNFLLECFEMFWQSRGQLLTFSTPGATTLGSVMAAFRQLLTPMRLRGRPPGTKLECRRGMGRGTACLEEEWSSAPYPPPCSRSSALSRGPARRSLHRLPDGPAPQPGTNSGQGGKS